MSHLMVKYPFGGMRRSLQQASLATASKRLLLKVRSNSRGPLGSVLPPAARAMTSAAPKSAGPPMSGAGPPPMPDLSHLTEEERRIIESVMARQKEEEDREKEILKSQDLQGVKERSGGGRMCDSQRSDVLAVEEDCEPLPPPFVTLPSSSSIAPICLSFAGSVSRREGATSKTWVL
ncbi:hypothetical protein HPB49_002600 [Dermacentor silvarum]|uniref:Uncharacterized protein n=1 Tax=Dermacentor silvarum TaxID=543639 RepID=A0ACB8CUN5_DERSI|nr:hypothetical protein HPB49_002600 [Dermacentor silvarum]